MSSVDITSLVIKVSSDGISLATKSLNELATAATNVEKRSSGVSSSMKTLEASQKASADAITNLLTKFQKQADLLGINTSSTNAYNVALKHGTELEKTMAAMLGAEVDAYKRLSVAQTEAYKQKATMQQRDIELQKIASAQYLKSQAEAIKMNNALDASNKRLEQDHLRAIIEDQRRAYISLALAQAEAIKMNNTYDASLRRLRIDETRVQQQQLNNVLSEAHAIVRGLSGAMGALWLTYGNIAGMLVGVALGSAIKEAVSGFAKVEYQMTFMKALTEDTTHSVHDLTQAMHEVAGALGISPEQAAKGLRALAQAGLDTTEALKTLPVAFKLATVGELDLDTAALAMTGVMNAYGLKVNSLEHIGDVMAKAGAESAASVNSISVSMKYAAGSADQYGVSLEKLGVVLTLLGKRGITGSSAGVAANNLITELYSPSSEKAIKAQAALGVKAYVDGVRQELPQVMESFKSGLQGFNSESQGRLLEDAFGKKGGKAFYAMAKATTEEFAAMEEKFVNSTGFTADVFKETLKTLEGQTNLTKSAITNAFAKIGEESSEPLKALMVVIRGLANNTDLQDAFIGLTQSIITFGKVVAPITIAVGGLFIALKAGPAVIAAVTYAMSIFSAASFASAYGAVGAAVTGLIGAFQAGNIAMLLANPIVAGLVGVVTLLAGAYLLLHKNQDSMHEVHIKEMERSGETTKALEGEISLMEKKLELQRKGVASGDMEAGIAAMQAQERAQTLKERIASNQSKITDLSATTRSSEGGDLSRQTSIDRIAKENKQLAKDLVDQEVQFTKELALKKKYADLRHQFNETERIKSNSEDLASQGIAGAVGTKVFGTKENKAAERDSLNAELQFFQNEINRAKKQAEVEKSTAQSLYKQGLIGENALIQANYDATVKNASAAINAITGKIAAMDGEKNRLAETSRQQGRLDELKETKATADITRQNALAEQYVKVEQDILKAQVAAYTAKGEFVKAFLADDARRHDLNTNRLIDNYERETDSAKKAMLEQAILVSEGAKSAGANAAAVKEAANEFELLNAKMTNVFKGVQTASENGGMAAMWKAATAAQEEYQANLPDLIAAQQKLAFAALFAGDNKGLILAQEALTKITAQGEHLKTTWSGVGQSITKSLESAFGRAGKAVGELMNITRTFSNLQEKTDGARVKAYGDAAGAAKSFFKEGTTGYKLMEGAEKAFRLVELAGLAQSISATVTGEAIKNTAKVPGVFMRFLSDLGPWGMAAAGVAIAGVLGGAFGGGGSIDLSAQRQASAGTGSVLGATDSKSESISNSLSILENNSGLGLVHSSAMVNSLKAIQTAMSGLASLVTRTTGITTGNVPGVTEEYSKWFGGSTTIRDKGIIAASSSLGSVKSVGLNAQSYAEIESSSKFLGITYSKSTKTQFSMLSSEIQEQLKKVVTNLSDGVTAAANVLGLNGSGFAAHLNQFVVDIGEISGKGLTGVEFETQLKAVFSKLGDDMARFGVAGLDEFQKVGEGYFETLSRLANDFTQVSDVLAVLGKSFNVTGIDAIKLSENLINAAGGLESLTSGTKFFIENFLSKAEQMNPVIASVNARMSELGQSSIRTTAEFSKLVLAQNLNTAEGQSMYAALIAIAPAFKQAADYADELTNGTVSLTKAEQAALDILAKQRELDIRLMEATGNTVGAVAARRSDELAALTKLSPALAATQQAIYDATDATEAYNKSQIKAAEELKKAEDANDKMQKDAATEAAKREGIQANRSKMDIRVQELLGNSAQALADKRTEELNAMNETLRPLQNFIYGLEDAALIADAASKLQASRSVQDIRVKELAGDAAGALADKRIEELAAMNPLLRETQKYIYTLEDAATATEKSKEANEVAHKAWLDSNAARERISEETSSLSVRIAEASGNAVFALAAKRDVEREKIDAINKPYLEYLYLLEDNATALEKVKDAEEKAHKAFEDANAKREDLMNKRSDMDIYVLELYGDAAGALAAKRRVEIAALDASLRPLQEWIYAVEDGNKAIEEAKKAAEKVAEIAKQQRGLDIQLMELTGNAVGALKAKRADELASLDVSLRATQLAIYAAQDLAAANENAAKAEKDRTDKISDAKSVLTTAYNAEASALQATIDKFKAFSDSLRKFKDGLLLGDLSTLSPEQKYLQSKLNFERTSAQAAGGDATAIGNLENVSKDFLDASRGYNASTEAYVRDFESVQRGLTQGIAASDMQVSIAQSQLAVLNAQVKGLVDIKDAVISVKDALASYFAAVNAPAVSATPSAPVSFATNQSGWAAQQLANFKDMVRASPGYDANSDYSSSYDAFAKGLGIDGSHYDGIDKVPHDNYLANLHANEKVVTARQAASDDKTGADTVRLLEKIVLQNEELMKHGEASVQQRGAIAEVSIEKLEDVATKLEGLKRVAQRG